MKTVWPYELFRLDFDQLLEEGKRQEEIDKDNIGEYLFVSRIHGFFDKEILPMVISNDWVYESATVFATDYVRDCFLNLRLTGQEVYHTQQKLLQIKELVADFFARAIIAEAASSKDLQKLTKISDFLDYIELEKLDQHVKQYALKLKSVAIDHEELQLRVVLRAIGSCYETTLTRIMFVVRRAMKASSNTPPSNSDNKLLKPSNYFDWLTSYTLEHQDHILNHIFVTHKEFYRVSRNVSNHHLGLRWLSNQNLVLLPDNNNTLQIHVDDFHRRFRYLNYFCELGLRGILSAFSKREKGEISNRLVREYRQTFPQNWRQGEQGLVNLYPE